MKKERPRMISTGVVAKNRRAQFDYAIGETVEAGLALTGAEVKSLRAGRANISDGYAEPDSKGFVLVNVSIGEYSKSDAFRKREEKRPRRLLLNKPEIRRLFSEFNKERATIVPLRLYFNARGIAKVLLGVGRGKTLIDKREAIKRREWDREKQRIMRINKGGKQ
ncbi:MAG: SsrA-binding protein SmpB [Rickettsiales bacterium]|jgi:SsrA-binding protein|nr:SsrA-binding protein SmpB [Rickettsiales bacterium]